MTPGKLRWREGTSVKTNAIRSEGPGDWQHYSTPKSVQKCRRRCTRKRSAEAGYRFYALYDKINREDILRTPKPSAAPTRGAPGVDGQDSPTSTEYGVAAVAWRTWRLRLGTRTTGPDPIRRVFIPKATAKRRPLGISTRRDRVLHDSSNAGAGGRSSKPTFQPTIKRTDPGAMPNRR